MRSTKKVSFEGIREAKVQNPWSAYEYGYPDGYHNGVVVVVAKSGRTARLLAMRAVYGEGGAGELRFWRQTPISLPGAVVFKRDGGC